MIKRKTNHVFLGFALVLAFFIGLYVLYRVYVFETEPIGQISGTELKLNGITYIAEMNVKPIQQSCSQRVGRTQNGDVICKIDGESPRDFVYVIGDMWQCTYRRESLPARTFTTDDIAMIVSGKRTSTDSELIQQVVSDLNSGHSVPMTIPTGGTDYAQYGLEVRLKSLPGLTFPYLLIRQGGHLYLETNMQNNTFINIDGTALQRWVEQSTSR
ncbi:hypothetical protein [Alicyclobacillus herbarius]|uniref:hypothetical protein n=1 Tax=Alicyclobacillus herbarius TaxID=122960 RepID=UPI000423307F|nr:hypothetical protein [Alicyclobacillus herbarius]